MENERLEQLASLAGLINPQVGMIANVLVGIFGQKRRGMHRDAKAILAWIEERSVNLLEQIVEGENSRSRQRELEIRLHETLDILMDVEKDKPWN